MARFRLIPREEKFYDDFVAVSGELRGGARLLEEMLAPEHPVWDRADEIKEVEHKCDFLTHAIIQRLHRTFVTPIDREDIHELASSVDSIMDAIDHCAAHVRLYKIEKVRPGALVIALVAVALLFDYINGFHDAANSIATVVSTRVLSPGKAVIWAAFFNAVAGFVFGTAVAKTVGSGMIDLGVVTFAVIFSGLLGAIVWDLLTWYYG